MIISVAVPTQTSRFDCHVMVTVCPKEDLNVGRQSEVCYYQVGTKTENFTITAFPIRNEKWSSLQDNWDMEHGCTETRNIKFGFTETRETDSQ